MIFYYYLVRFLLMTEAHDSEEHTLEHYEPELAIMH